MGFIGVQPTSAPLTSSDITDGIVTTATIADDAVGNTKLDLTANYAFTGTVSGTNGKVLQVVTATPVTASYYSSTDSYMSTTLSLQITPSATTSKIFLQYSVSCHGDQALAFCITDIYKNPTSSLTANTVASGGSLLSGKGASGYGLAQTYDAGDASISNQGVSFMNSPSTTSQILYLVVYRNHGGGNAYFNINDGVASFTAMEIGA